MLCFLPKCCTDQELEGNRSREDEEMFLYGFITSTTMKSESGVCVVAESVHTEGKMRVHHSILKVVVERL